MKTERTQIHFLSDVLGAFPNVIVWVVSIHFDQMVTGKKLGYLQSAYFWLNPWAKWVINGSG